MMAAEPGAWRPFAGGTDLMVLLEAGKLAAGRYLSLQHFDELRGISTDDQAIVIGALTTYSDVMRSAVLQAECPLLCRAAADTGGVATQNRGTIGGNIANASPAADTPPALLVYDASVDLVSVRGMRRVPYDRFHLGYKRMDLAPDELIHSVRVVRGRGELAAGMAQGRHAPGAGDFENLRRRGRPSYRRHRRRRPDRVRQRGADGGSRRARGSGAARTGADGRNDRGVRRGARPGPDADRRPALHRALPPARSRQRAGPVPHQLGLILKKSVISVDPRPVGGWISATTSSGRGRRRAARRSSRRTR